MARLVRPNAARAGYSPVHHPPSSSRAKVYGVVASLFVVVIYFMFMTGGGDVPINGTENSEWASAYPSQATPAEDFSNNLRGSDSAAATPEVGEGEQGLATVTDGEKKAGFDEYDGDTLKEDSMEVEVAIDVAKLEIEELVEEEAVIEAELAMEEKVDETRDIIFGELNEILKDLDLPVEKKSTEFVNQLTAKIIENLKDDIDAEIVKSGEAIMEEKEDAIDEVVAEDQYLGVSGGEEKLDVEIVLEEAKTDIVAEFQEMENTIEGQLKDRTEEKMEDMIKIEVGLDVDVHKVIKDKKRKSDNEEIDSEVIQAKVIMEEAEEEEVMLAKMDIDMLLEQKKPKITLELMELFEDAIGQDEVNDIANRIIDKFRDEAESEIEFAAGEILEDKEAEMDRAIDDDKKTGFFTKQEVEEEVDEIEEETLDRVEAEVTAMEKDIEKGMDKKIDTLLKKEIIEKAKKDEGGKKKKEEDTEEIELEGQDAQLEEKEDV
jgi:hypothetical protein